MQTFLPFPLVWYLIISSACFMCRTQLWTCWTFYLRCPSVAWDVVAARYFTNLTTATAELLDINKGLQALRPTGVPLERMRSSSILLKRRPGLWIFNSHCWRQRGLLGKRDATCLIFIRIYCQLVIVEILIWCTIKKKKSICQSIQLTFPFIELVACLSLLYQSEGQHEFAVSIHAGLL